MNLACPLLPSTRQPTKRGPWPGPALAAVAALAALTLAPPLAAELQFLGPQGQLHPNRQETDSFPNVDSNAAGAAVVAWHCGRAVTSSDICARRILHTGTPTGPILEVTPRLAGIQQFADVAVADDGRFFVVWESNAGEDGDGWSVLGRFYAANGTPLGPQQVLNTNGSGRQRNPAVAWRRDRGWVVAWDSNHAGFPEDVYFRRFAPSGNPQGGDVLASTQSGDLTLSGANRNAAVDADSAGNFVIAWQGPRSSGGSETYGRRFLNSGAARGGPFRVATLQPSQKQFPAVSVNSSGAFVVLFSRTDGTIAARRYRNTGAAQGAEFQVSQQEASTTGGDVALADDGSFVTSWTGLVGAPGPTDFAVFARAYRSNGSAAGPEQQAASDGSRPHIAVDAAGDVTFAFHAAGPNAGWRGAQSNTNCRDDATAACLTGNRFKVEVAWETLGGDVGIGQAEQLTAETATFWFFDPSNVELVLKQLDACGLNQRFWTFAAGVTDVAIDISVTDTDSGVRRSYSSPAGVPFATVRDTDAFACDGSPTAAPSLDGAASTAPTLLTSATLDLLEQVDQRQCAGSADSLCLNQSRFSVDLTFRTPGQSPQAATAVPLTGDSGYFWFFDPGNVELLIKVLDGCGINQRYWVFAAGLTDLELDLQVFDSDAQQLRVYRSLAGQGFGPVLDTSAFATCP